MRLLYRSNFEERYRAVANLILNGVSVVDVCSGDSYLYLRYLRKNSVEYLGLEASHEFVSWARRHGVNVSLFDIWNDDIPQADVVVMQASLYQFQPEAEKILRKLLKVANHQVIISEPIQNLSSSRISFISRLSKWLTVPPKRQDTYSGERFNRESLEKLFHRLEEFERCFIIAGGMEMIGIFHADRSNER